MTDTSQSFKMENKIILHRGYKGKYPENSEISFVNALKENLAFETDIRISKDGVPFLIHDDDLYRLFNGIGKIKDLSSEELEKFNYREDNKLGLFELEKLCILIRNLSYDNLIFIHIKELKDIDKVIEVLDKYNLYEIVRFFAVDEITLELIKTIKNNYPEYQVGLHFNDNSKINEEKFRLADFIWADEINKKNITEELVSISHSFGKPIYVISPELISESIFNSDIEGRWKEFIEMEVDGICTDKPVEFFNFFS